MVVRIRVKLRSSSGELVTSALANTVLLRPGDGLWRFLDDPPHVRRTSERKEAW